MPRAFSRETLLQVSKAAEITRDGSGKRAFWFGMFGCHAFPEESMVPCLGSIVEHGLILAFSCPDDFFHRGGRCFPLCKQSVQYLNVSRMVFAVMRLERLPRKMRGKRRMVIGQGWQRK